MAWKRLRPSTLHTVCTSIYIGVLISLLTATVVGAIFMLVSYVSTSTQIQWIRTMSAVTSCVFLYIWYFVLMLFLFRPFQLIGVKRKLILVCFFTYCLDSLYRVALQALGISHSHISRVQKILLHALFLINACLQVCLITNHVCTRSRIQKLTFFFSLIILGCFSFLISIIVGSVITQRITNKQTKANC